MIERTTVRLPSELLDRARRKAAGEGRTLTSLIEEGLRDKLDEPVRKPKRRRVSLPVSKATGGLLPGIDISRSAALQELEDVEYLQRVKTLR